MNAMSLDDLKEMVRFRLSVAGYQGELFEDDEEAYKVLYPFRVSEQHEYLSTATPRREPHWKNTWI